uniref:XoxJ n=1 Tax=uncultured bacterium BAC10-4 TaxID=333425 RepID=Q4JIU3_9BACT|nr:XoxJ [uncultured bacterium BAC10-4]
MMIRRAASPGGWFLASNVLLLACCLAGTASGDQSEPIRVCADPDSLPYSNTELQGFENKIAEVVGQELGTSVSYFWWPAQMGLIRHTLKVDQCEVLISIPKGYDPVLWTKPYYRSAYVLAYRKDRNLGLRSLDDPALKGLRIGVHVNTPPYDALANRGLAENMVNYRLFFDPQDPDPSRRPEKVLQDVLSGAIDVAVAWGPMVGYFVKQHPPALEVVALDDDAKLPMSFEFSMGVRKGNRELKARLEGALDRRQADITRILADYGIPLLPLGPPGESAEQKPSPPGSHKHDSYDQ